MTPLRQRMIEDMQLRGLSEITQDRYVRAVRQLAEHYGKSPDKIAEEDLRRYFLYLKNDKQAARSTWGFLPNPSKRFNPADQSARLDTGLAFQPAGQCRESEKLDENCIDPGSLHVAMQWVIPEPSAALGFHLH